MNSNGKEEEEEAVIIYNSNRTKNEMESSNNEETQGSNQLSAEVANEVRESQKEIKIDVEAKEVKIETTEEVIEEIKAEQVEEGLKGTNDQVRTQTKDGALSEAVIRTIRPLCADYESDSVDSESDSSSSLSSSTSSSNSEDSSDSSSESDSEDSGTGKSKTVRKNPKKDTSQVIDLPPIEDLKISVPEDACVEVGTISSIVDTLVVVESYKDSSALDVDTVLFLDKGERTLGKVFDILGPINEPVYTVRFNNVEQIKSLNIEKGLKVYYAPKTQHTNFVFMSEVLKNRGSDASWKDNVEAPPEFQDFSDDEEERIRKNEKRVGVNGENSNPKDQTRPKKRPFSKSSPSWMGFPNNRQRNPTTQRFPSNFHNSPSFSPHRPSFSSPSPTVSTPSHFPPSTPPHFSSPPNFPSHPPFSPRAPYPYQTPLPPPPPLSRFYAPPRFSGPPFPSFTALSHPPQGFRPVFYQQTTHSYGCQWQQPMFNPRPPPPPPPSSAYEQGDRQQHK